jgi:hypothetical protein
MSRDTVSEAVGEGAEPDRRAARRYSKSTPSRLMAARCTNLACSSATLTKIGDASYAYPAIATGADGLALIPYADTGRMKVVHCSNVFCIPYFPRR